MHKKIGIEISSFCYRFCTGSNPAKNKIHILSTMLMCLLILMWIDEQKKERERTKKNYHVFECPCHVGSLNHEKKLWHPDLKIGKQKRQ